MDIACPFCSLEDFDLQYILEHIEYCHPDDTESCPNSNHNSERPALKTDFEEGLKYHDSGSEIEYVQCECGEHVQLSEFTNHLALHLSEEITTDPIPPINDQLQRTPTGASSGTESATDTRLQLCTSSSRRKNSKHADHLEQRQGLHSSRSIVGRLVGSASSTTQSATAKTKHMAPRRLGVRGIFKFYGFITTDFSCRLRSWVLMLMKIKCLRGSANNSNVTRKPSLEIKSGRTGVSFGWRPKRTKHEAPSKPSVDYATKITQCSKCICAIPMCNTLSKWLEREAFVGTEIFR